MNSKKDEKNIFKNYILENNLKNSVQRERILDIFLKLEKHLTIEELHKEVKKKYSNIGYVTVYRTMKLLVESGLAMELSFQDGLVRYEHLYKHKHHDHLICVVCGKCIEVFDKKIEDLQNNIFKKNNFISKSHKLELYGICKDCQNK